MFRKILVANRGEIAVRVIRACRELGIPSAAVYSDADRAALHVLMADEAYSVGTAAAAESYLNISKILEVAKCCGADAIHPGYGFLSENAKFAQACAGAGIKFIGPSAASMEMMGSKTRARQEMEKAGVPFVPGTSRALESGQQANEIAAKIGYPVMLKAAAGGGGKGMRLVHTAEALQPSLEAAQSEAQRAFGDGEVYLEKAILNPRHIEMQVLADEHGNAVYLGERECSIQRRHQKVLEEAPSIAAGEELPFRQEDIVIRGHAIECRIYAEDADNNFFPSPGKIETLLTPAGPGIRLDNGVYSGWTVPIDYDPLLAKLIAYGQDRQQAISRLARALPEYFVAGIKTNLGLFRRILADKSFQSGEIDTGYLERLLKIETDGEDRKGTADVAAIAAAVFTVLESRVTASNNGTGVAGAGPATSSWKRAARTEGLM